jgi:hypothetical protein
VSGPLTFDLLSVPRLTGHVRIAPIIDHMQFEWLSGKNSRNKNTSLNDLGKSSAHNISAFGWQFTEVAAFSKKIEFQN